MKVLITGGTGFVGSNFVYRFLERGDEVHLLVRLETRFWRIEPVKDRVTLHTIDLAKEKEVVKFITDLKPEIILHFATYGAYQGREQDAETTVRTNVLGTVNLMRACAEVGFKCFINTGTTSEYGEKDHPMREDELLEPNNLYGVTKAAATMFGKFLAQKHNLPLVTMRLFSVYGPYEDPRRLVPVVIKACLENTALNLASASFVRDFVFIEDVMEAYDAAIAQSERIKGEIFNVGTGVQHSIGDIVEVANHVTGATIKPAYGTMAAVQHEPSMWVADIAKIKTTLDWKPSFSLERGMEKNIEWFRRNLAHYQ